MSMVIPRGTEFAFTIDSGSRDLSETSLTYLPTRGLSDLEVLRLVDTKTLKVIPSVYNFKVSLNKNGEMRCV